MIKASRRTATWVLLAALCLLSCAGAEQDISLHLHTDPHTGVSFGVPDGWKEETFSQNGYAGFDAYTNYEGPSRSHGRYLIFMHIISDAYRTRGSRQFDTRQAYDEYLNQVPNIYQAAGIRNAPPMTVEFNGITYFAYDSGDSVWQFFHAHNGYLHMFQFDTGMEDPNFAYFRAIMNSVTFPDAEE